jgi:p-hydroxybenzoate 3-monooxygenase
MSQDQSLSADHPQSAETRKAVLGVCVPYLSRALIRFFKDGRRDGIDTYSQTALARVWKSERFSWSLTMLMHRFPEGGDFGRRMQIAELEYIAGSTAARTVIAENYVGLPL